MDRGRDVEGDVLMAQTINGIEAQLPLVAFRAVLGDERVEQLQERAAVLRFQENYSVEELLCFAEFFRLMAELASWRETDAAEEDL
jgi:hypothetical protein